MGTNPGFTLAVKNRKEDDDVYDYSYSLRNSLKRRIGQIMWYPLTQYSFRGSRIEVLMPLM